MAISRSFAVGWYFSAQFSVVAFKAYNHRDFYADFFHGAKTRAGVPLRVQLLGSDPACLADNAALACQLGSEVIDLNFGCPAKTVNKSRGGAVLLKEPELLHAILLQVRRTVPAHIPVTAKMRLGFDTPDSANECAIALAEGGASQIVVQSGTFKNLNIRLRNATLRSGSQ